MKSFRKSLIIWWVSITAIYTALDLIFNLSDNSISVGDYITGFFGLFVPIGIISILTGLLFPVIMTANLTALFLILFFIAIGSKIKVSKLIGTFLILAVLLGITFISDQIRKDIVGKTSWDIFISGKNDFSNI